MTDVHLRYRAESESSPVETDVTVIGSDSEVQSIGADGDEVRFLSVAGVGYTCELSRVRKACSKDKGSDSPNAFSDIYVHPLSPGGLLNQLYPSLAATEARTVAGQKSDCYTGTPTYDAGVVGTFCIHHDLGFLTFSDEKSLKVTLLDISVPDQSVVELPPGVPIEG